jgi:hypothetical protein
MHFPNHTFQNDNTSIRRASAPDLVAGVDVVLSDIWGVVHNSLASSPTTSMIPMSAPAT